MAGRRGERCRQVAAARRDPDARAGAGRDRTARPGARPGRCAVSRLARGGDPRRFARAPERRGRGRPSCDRPGRRPAPGARRRGGAGGLARGGADTSPARRGGALPRAERDGPGDSRGSPMGRQREPPPARVAGACRTDAATRAAGELPRRRGARARAAGGRSVAAPTGAAQLRGDRGAQRGDDRRPCPPTGDDRPAEARDGGHPLPARRGGARTRGTRGRAGGHR